MNNPDYQKIADWMNAVQAHLDAIAKRTGTERVKIAADQIGLREYDWLADIPPHIAAPMIAVDRALMVLQDRMLNAEKAIGALGAVVFPPESRTIH